MPDATRSATLERLQTTLDRAPLPDRLRASGQSLAKRISSPVRLSFMGMPGVGKTTLIQALLGVELPTLASHDDQEIPTYELAYAETPHTVLTLEDGTRHELTDFGLAQTIPSDPVFAEVYVANERLRSIRMLDLVTDGSPDEMRAATLWAAQRCDIPIWCSRAFDEEDARVWAEVPAAKKNHAMLVLTQADKVPPDQLAQTLDNAFGLESMGFCIVAPVAAQHALRAQVTRGADEEKIVQASGIGALRQEIFRRVEQGRQLDLDHAELFLTRFENRKVRPVSKPRPIGQKTAAETTPSAGLANGANHIRTQAQEMLADIEEFGSFAPAKIVERCLETANALVDLIADETPVNDPQCLAHAAASDAADLLLLMTLENSSGAAEDAVHLIHQMKREFEQAA